MASCKDNNRWRTLAKSSVALKHDVVGKLVRYITERERERERERMDDVSPIDLSYYRYDDDGDDNNNDDDDVCPTPILSIPFFMTYNHAPQNHKPSVTPEIRHE